MSIQPEEATKMVEGLEEKLSREGLRSMRSC